MMTKSPSGGLSPYYYKGGYFHGIHYGSFFNDGSAFLAMMEKEETFILKSPQSRRILMDLYETDLSDDVMKHFICHIERMRNRIIKLAISCDKRSLRKLEKAFKKAEIMGIGPIYFSTDMEEAKTWLVSDHSSR